MSLLLAQLRNPKRIKKEIFSLLDWSLQSAWETNQVKSRAPLWQSYYSQQSNIMMLSNEDIIKFQTLYKERFGIVLSTQDAYEKGMKVLRMMSIVYRPITKKQQSITLARKKYLNQKINSKNA